MCGKSSKPFTSWHAGCVKCACARVCNANVDVFNYENARQNRRCCCDLHALREFICSLISQSLEQQPDLRGEEDIQQDRELSQTVSFEPDLNNVVAVSSFCIKFEFQRRESRELSSELDMQISPSNR